MIRDSVAAAGLLSAHTLVDVGEELFLFEVLSYSANFKTHLDIFEWNLDKEATPRSYQALKNHWRCLSFGESKAVDRIGPKAMLSRAYAPFLENWIEQLTTEVFRPIHDKITSEFLKIVIETKGKEESPLIEKALTSAKSEIRRVNGVLERLINDLDQVPLSKYWKAPVISIHPITGEFDLQQEHLAQYISEFEGKFAQIFKMCLSSRLLELSAIKDFDLIHPNLLNQSSRLCAWRLEANYADQIESACRLIDQAADLVGKSESKLTLRDEMENSGKFKKAMYSRSQRLRKYMKAYQTLAKGHTSSPVPASPSSGEEIYGQMLDGWLAAGLAGRAVLIVGDDPGNDKDKSRVFETLSEALTEAKSARARGKTQILVSKIRPRAESHLQAAINF